MKKGFVAFDNGGGATLVCKGYAHFYQDGKELARDVLAIICGADPLEDTWDGNDLELHKAMGTEDLSGYDQVWHFSAIRSVLAFPSRIVIDDNEVQVDGRNISGYTLGLFWRTIAAH